MMRVTTQYKVFLFLFVLILGSFSQVSIGKNNVLHQNGTILQENPIPTDETNYYAIIVGIDEYENNSNVNNNAETAISFFNQLIKGHNWDEANVRLLINEDATKSNIKSAIINWLNPLENKEDVVLFYFCGRTEKLSFQQKSFGNTYSIPFDASDSQFADDKITDKEFDSWFDTLDSHHISLIFDTSYASYMSALKQYRRSILTATGFFSQRKNQHLITMERVFSLIFL